MISTTLDCRYPTAIYRSSQKRLLSFLCPRSLCHGLCVSVRKHLVSVIYRTNASVDWTNLWVAYWGWLEKGFFRWPAPPLIQDGRYGSHLGFRLIINYLTRLSRLVRFVCGLLGITGGRFLSMISTAAHSRWALWHRCHLKNKFSHTTQPTLDLWNCIISCGTYGPIFPGYSLV
jgi:hypothetical protein